MATNILSIGASALNAAQVGISTTGHNIANASTAGYTRQVVTQNAALPQAQGYGFVGQGTRVDSVRRVYNDFLAQQVRSAQANKSQLDSQYAQVSQIDGLFADPRAGLAPAMQDFFDGLQGLASTPNSTAGRQTVLSSAESLVTRFQSLDDRLTELRQGVNSQVSSSVGVINTYAQQIAQLNDSIARAESSMDGQPANDLRDQRDRLVDQLAAEVSVSVVKQDNAYNVLIGNGQPLVVGLKANQLKAVASDTDPSRLEVALTTNGKEILLKEDMLAGGSLGGALEFRSQTLDAAQNQLGRVAIGLAASFNAQHRLGQDLNGRPGGDFFTQAQPLVTSSSTNSGKASLGAVIADAGAITASDYRVKFDGRSYTVTRLADGQQQAFSSFPQSIDGLTLTLDTTQGGAAAGDEFLVRPTALGASALEVALADTSAIAAAAPIRTRVASANTGSGKIDAGQVDSSYLGAPLTGPITFRYDSASNSISGPGGYSAAYVDGGTLSYGGIRFKVSGAPANGDQFVIEPNTGGSGDNRNALALGTLQTAATLAGGSTTLQGAYGQLVSFVGNQAHELEVTSGAQAKLLEEATTAQQAESGVNLDEEAANLLRYQQAYQAAGKVMQIASDLFQTLLALGR